MPEYVVDYFSKFGRLFRSDRIVASNDAIAKLWAISIVPSTCPDTYKITRLEAFGIKVIRHRRPRNRRESILYPVPVIPRTPEAWNQCQGLPISGDGA